MIESFLVWCPDYGSAEEDAKELRAHSHESACQEWAQRSDAESADYTIVRGNDVTVLVKAKESVEMPRKFTITGETVAQYYAREVRHD